MFRRRPKAPPRSPGQQALVDLHDRIAMQRAKISDIEARLDRFATAEAAADEAAAALQSFIARDNGAQLCSVATGAAGADPQFVLRLGRTEDSRKAADLARQGRPKASQELDLARAELVRLEAAMPACIADLLVAELDKIGRRYKEAWGRLVDVYGEMAGASQALQRLGRDGVLMTGADGLEAARFAVPSLTAGQNEYRPTMQSNGAIWRIDRAADAWSAAAEALAKDPTAAFDHLTADRAA